MARGNRFGFRPTSSRGPRRVMQWDTGPFSSVIQSATANGTTLIDTGVEASEPLTTVRIRGELTIWLEVVTTIGDGFTVYHAGIGIVTADAFAQGAGSMPTPGGDDDWPGWMWHHSGAALIGLETTEVARGPLSAVRIPIDSKAMRKIGTNEVQFGAVQFGGEVGAATASFVMNTRVLDKLS